MSVVLSVCYRRFPLSIKSRLVQPCRNGYVVLLPEISPDIQENAALMKDDVPDFASLTTEKCVTTMGKHLLNFEQSVRVVEQSVEKAGCSDVVKEIIEPLEKASAPLDTSWGIIKNLYMTRPELMPGKTYVPLHHRARRARLAKFYSKAINKACKECDQTKLTEEEQRVVDKYLLEGKLAGLDLDENKRQELAGIHIKMAESRAEFARRVSVSSGAFKNVIRDPTIIKEMPDHLLRLMAENKQEPNRGPWCVTLEPQLRELFLQYCSNRELRWNVWQAHTRVASQSLDDTELRNSATLEKIRALRKEEANILGYKHYADLSMETKMAGSLENVQQTLSHIHSIAKPAADREIATLQQFAWERGFEESLESFDVPYWGRKQKRALFDYQEETLNDFFPFDKVWGGLLSLCERLFDIKIVESTKTDKWHPDVRFFHIFEDSNKPVAGFYLDPYEREGKPSASSEAWIVNITPAARIHKTLPLSSVVLHLDAPVYGKPALLSWSEVQLIFRKFGHLMQQLLTTVNYTEVSGHSNIEWDAVEIVENVFLHWLKEPAVLESISGHYATGEKLPLIPFTKIDRHMAGFRLCEELFKAHLDLEMYSTKDFWQDIMRRLWPAHFTLPHDSWDSRPCSWLPVVTGQYSAAYYSHLWAAMVAADVYSAFTEPDTDLPAIGARFRDTYLAFGGSCHPGEVFRRFRGRDPSSEAYLKYLGLH